MGLLSTTHHYHAKTVREPYEKSVTINQHRAPTDESVRLLKEFQEKAVKNLIDSVRINTMGIDVLVFVFNQEMISDEVELRVVFSINGHNYKLQEKIKRGDYRNEIRKNSGALSFNQSIIKTIHEFLSKAIAREILINAPEVSEMLKSLNSY